MKRLAFIIALAAALASCTVRKDNTCARSARDLADFSADICRLVGDDVVVRLTEAISDSVQVLFRAGLDTTLSTHAFGSLIRVTCQNPADSSLAVSMAGEARVSFQATLNLTGRDADGQPLWKWSGNGMFDEKDNYSTTFESTQGGLDYNWTKLFYSHDYGILDSVYVAIKTGGFRAVNYFDGKQLDWIELKYRGKEAFTYNGSIHD